MRPWLAVLLLVATACGNGCRPAVSRNQLVDPVQFHRLTPGGAPAQYSGLTLATRTVVTDSASFVTLWRHAFSSASGDTLAPPAVDWTRQKVVFVGLGERASGGNAIEVTSVQRIRDELLIAVETTTPGNCPGAEVMTQPVDVVTIPRTKPGVLVRFVERERIGNCP